MGDMRKSGDINEREKREKEREKFYQKKTR